MNIGKMRRRMNVGEKPNYLMTSETNPEVLAILYANGLCSNSEYLTYAEAAAITSFPTRLFFKANIKSFDELEFFGVKRIPVDCFNSSTVTSITLSDKITNIDGSGIRGCASLERITCKATTPPKCAGNYALGGLTNPNAIYVPAASVDAYKIANSWDAFANKIFAIE